MIDAIPDRIANKLKDSVTKILESSTLFYRVFSRKKSSESLLEKFQKKTYSPQHKIQDLFGIRVVLYFKDDIPICRKIIEKNFDVVDISEDKEEMEVFKPIRLNYVCRMPQDIKEYIEESLWSDYPIDDTFEIQIRTVFSEGWHEIEHDLRYKCKEDWNGLEEMSRTLNGIFATLETCDWSIISLFDQLAYSCYKKKDWKAMIRNKYRVRLSKDLSTSITEIFNRNVKIAKKFFRIDREDFVIKLSEISVPKNYDNIIYIVNELIVKDEEIKKIVPAVIKEKCENLINIEKQTE